MSRPVLRAAIPPLLAGLLAGCGACGHEQRAQAPAPKSGDLPTEEVAPPPDARVDVTRDRQEHRRAESFSGVLPGGFPRGLPLPPQASLVDQGPRWVEVLVPRHLTDVQQPYLAQLRGAGWSASAGGGGAFELHRGAAAVHLQVRAQGPSTRLRLAY
jgi:hypothetical protein